MLLHAAAAEFGHTLHVQSAYMFFLYFTTDLRRKPNRQFFKNKQKPKPNPRFPQNQTELEKSILHIPNFDCVRCHSNFLTFMSP